MRYSSALASASERREFNRTLTTLRGKVFPGALDCTVRDHSPRGARLGFAGQPPADERIVLVIWATGLAYDAVRRWTAGAEIGVQFRRPVDLRGTVPPHLAEVKAQWLDRRRQLRRRQLNSCGATIEPLLTPRHVRIS